MSKIMLKNMEEYNINRPKTITAEQGEKLIANIKSEQTKLILKLAIETGMRISDVLRLKVGDIKQNPMTIYETKSKRERTLKISPELHFYLKQYCAGRSDSSMTFFSVRRDAIAVHRVSVHRQIKKALKTLDFDASAHSTRKLYAQNILRATGSIEEVQKALNHQNVLTTATYLDINLDKLIKTLSFRGGF